MSDIVNEVDEKIDTDLNKHGVYYLSGELDEHNTGDCIKWILHSNMFPKLEYLTIIVNSFGGQLFDAFGLIDFMKMSKIPVRTIGTGNVMSAALLILAAGQKGYRYISKSTTVMSHQFSSGTEGKQHELLASLKDIKMIQKKMEQNLVEATGLELKVVRKKLLPPSDVWLSVEETIEYKLCDNIIEEII